MKYNDNGTYKDIYVKTFDTLPIGAIVEYNGATIPSGWTNIGNNQIQKISQFVPGKYQVNGTYSTSQNEAYSCEYINKIGTQITNFGDILTTDGTYSATCYSTVCGTYIGGGIWEIKTEGKLEYLNAGTNYFTYGFSIDKINTLLGLNLRNYNKTSTASNYIYIKENGQEDTGAIGYGTLLQYLSNLNALEPARYYTSSGNAGGWPLNQFSTNTVFRTTIYLKEQ